MAEKVSARDADAMRSVMASLVDGEALQLVHPQATDNVWWGQGQVDGRPVVVYATDPARAGGSLGASGCEQIVSAIHRAREIGCAIIGVWHCAGAQLQGGPASLDGFGRIFAAMISASGRVPQIAVVLGPAAGGAAYGPALGDIVIMGPSARIFVTGPDVIRSVTGEVVDAEALGGPGSHASRSGLAHIVATSDAAAISSARFLANLLCDLGIFDGSLHSHISYTSPEPGARGVRPDPGMRSLMCSLFDEHRGRARSVIELHPHWGCEVSTYLGRLYGRTVGVLGADPQFVMRPPDPSSCNKAARFVRTCDSYGVPLIMAFRRAEISEPVTNDARRWHYCAQLIYALYETAVPRATLLLQGADAETVFESRLWGVPTVYAQQDHSDVPQVRRLLAEALSGDGRGEHKNIPL